MTKLSLLTLFSVVVLTACSDDEKQIQEATSTDQPVITSETSANASSAAMNTKQKITAGVKEIPLAEAPKVEEQAKEQAAAVHTAATAVDGQAIYATCAGCHGQAGEGGVGPKLQGLAKDGLIASLKDYKAGVQKGPMSSMMIPNAQTLSEADIEAVSEYITKL